MSPRLLAAFCALSLLACSPEVETAPPIAGVAQDAVLAPPPEMQPPAEATRVVLRENVTTRTYAVRGESAGSLRSSLNREGPYSAAAGRRFDALTTWNLRWSFRFQTESGACRLLNATLELDLTILLPEPADAGALPERTLVAWQAYRAALEQHEIGHVERQLAGARGLKARFESAGSRPTCDELGDALRSMGDAQVAAGRAADIEYDLSTDHGRLQGAVFP